jgi:hypothetical protein
VAGPAVRVEGLNELRRGIKKMDKELAKEFRDELKKLAEESAIDARGAAQGGTRQQQAAAYNIVGSGTRAGGSVVVSAGNDLPFALGAFWGSKRPQFPGLPWVGKSWEAGVHGQGPYFINDAIADDAELIEHRIGELVERLARTTRAFPT